MREVVSILTLWAVAACVDDEGSLAPEAGSIEEALDAGEPDLESAPGNPGVAPQLMLAADRADAVFFGEVTSVEYTLAEFVAHGEPWSLPHTFVTYRVLRGLKGGTPGESVTLRFLGGPGRDGLVMMVSDVPLFDVGEQDVLFVSGNGVTGCPLVECAMGRVRVIGGALYSDDGHALRMEADGVLRLGERHDLPEVMANDVGGYLVTREPSAALATVADPAGVGLDFLAATLPELDFPIADLGVRVTDPIHIDP